MDFSDSKQVAVFFDIHDGLPRQGPGNLACAKHALEIVGDLPAAPHVLDVGCGPGQQTLYLADLLPTAKITAIDFYPAFIDDLKQRALTAGVADRIDARVGDMAALDVAPGSVDLIWCEGAAYIMGVENALRAWKPLLAPGGKMALSEAVWLKGDPPAPVRACWEEYPAMKDIAFNRQLVERCGYRLLGDFVLPEEAWWDDYYGPLEERVKMLEATYKDDPVTRAVWEESRQEIDVYRQHSDYYSYVFLIMETA